MVAQAILSPISTMSALPSGIAAHGVRLAGVGAVDPNAIKNTVRAAENAHMGKAVHKGAVAANDNRSFGQRVTDVFLGILKPFEGLTSKIFTYDMFAVMVGGGALKWLGGKEFTKKYLSPVAKGANWLAEKIEAPRNMLVSTEFGDAKNIASGTVRKVGGVFGEKTKAAFASRADKMAAGENRAASFIGRNANVAAERSAEFAQSKGFIGKAGAKVGGFVEGLGNRKFANSLRILEQVSSLDGLSPEISGKVFAAKSAIRAGNHAHAQEIFEHLIGEGAHRETMSGVSHRIMGSGGNSKSGMVGERVKTLKQRFGSFNDPSETIRKSYSKKIGAHDKAAKLIKNAHWQFKFGNDRNAVSAFARDIPGSLRKLPNSIAKASVFGSAVGTGLLAGNVVQGVGLKRNVSSAISSLKQMHEDITGEKISTLGLLTASHLPDALKGARAGVIKQYGMEAIANAVGVIANLKMITGGRNVGKWFIGEMGLGMAGPMLMGASDWTNIYQGLSNKQKAGEALTGDDYLVLITSANKDAQKFGAQNRITIELAKQYKNEGASIGQVLKEMTGGLNSKFNQRGLQIAQAIKRESANKPVLGKFTQNLAQGQEHTAAIA